MHRSCMAEADNGGRRVANVDECVPRECRMQARCRPVVAGRGECRRRHAGGGLAEGKQRRRQRPVVQVHDQPRDVCRLAASSSQFREASDVLFRDEGLPELLEMKVSGRGRPPRFMPSAGSTTCMLALAR